MGDGKKVLPHLQAVLLKEHQGKERTSKCHGRTLMLASKGGDSKDFFQFGGKEKDVIHPERTRTIGWNRVRRAQRLRREAHEYCI